MNVAIDLNEAREIKRYNIDSKVNRWKIELGNLAIEQSDITINDPIIHLCDYIQRGDESLAGIREDFETNISERLKDKNAYILNKLKFTLSDNDFISTKDKVSMRSMTQNSLTTMQKTLAGKSNYFIEVTRAKAEIEEVDKITEWFKSAPVGSNIVFESLPIGENERYAFTRIYNKLSDSEIEGGFFSLHNPDINQFNNLRQEFNANTNSKNEIELLRDCYQINEPKLNNIDDTIAAYVGVYDQILSEKYNKKYSFGIETNDKNTFNGLTKVRQLSGQTDIYIDTINAFKNSNGVATDELVKINNDFKTENKLCLGQKLTTEQIREQLESVTTGIACTINEADEKAMIELLKVSDDKQANRNIASHFGAIATAKGEKFESGGCPEFRNDDQNETSPDGSDAEIISNAFGSLNKLQNFGKESYDICRINNCPSHPRPTKVGGCKVCVNCHLLFQKGKDPNRVYKYNNYPNDNLSAKKLAIIELSEKISDLKNYQNYCKRKANKGSNWHYNKLIKGNKELATLHKKQQRLAS